MTALESVIEAHQFVSGGIGKDASCYAEGCDWSHPWDRPTHEMWSVHRTHLADEIRAWLTGQRDAATEALLTSRLTWGVHADRWGDTDWQRGFWAEAAETVLGVLTETTP